MNLRTINWRPSLGLLLPGLLLLAPLTAIAAPPTATESAQQVREAHAAQNAKALRTLAERNDPDPWRVADALCAAGDYETAIAFVRAAPRNDTSTLILQIEALRKAPPSAEDRKRLDGAIASTLPDSAMSLLDALEAKNAGIWATRIALARAQTEATPEAWSRAALAARGIGWLQASANAYRVASRLHEKSQDDPAAVVAARARLAVELLRGRDARLAETLAETGRLTLAVNELADSEDLLRRALRQAEREDDDALEARVQQLLGLVLTRRDAPQDAMYYLRRAQDAFRKSENPAGVLAVEEALVPLEASTGGLAKGGVRAKAALALARELNDQPAQGRMLAALAAMDEQRKDWLGAIGRFDSAEAVFRAGKSKREAGECAYRSGRLHLRMGRLGMARGALRRSLEDAQETGAKSLEAHVHATLGTVELERGDRKLAAKHFDSAARLAEETKNAEMAARTLARAARLDVEFGKPADARRKLDRALPVLRRLDEKRDLINALLTLSEVEASEAKLEAARSYIDEVLVIARKEVTPGAIARAMASWARIDLLGGEKANATRAFDRVRAGAREALIAQEKSGLKPTPRFEHALEHLLAVGVDAALAANAPKLLLRIGEYRRSRRMLRDLGGREALLRALTPLAVQREQEEVRKREDAAIEEYEKQRERMDKNAMFAARAKVVAARDELAALQKKVEASAAPARSLLAPGSTALEEVQASLATSESLLYFCVGVEHVGALIVTSDGARLLKVGQRTVIAQGIDAFLNSEAGFRASDPRTAIGQMRQLLYVPLAIAEAHHDLVVSPVAPLDRIPFCLLDNDTTVRYVDSAASIITAAKAGALTGTGILGIGNTTFADGSIRIRLTHLRNGIPVRRLETARTLAADFKDAIVVGPPATEAAFRAAVVTRPRWHAIHFAVPVLLDGQRPYASLFGLAPGGGEDGTLDIFDMMRIGLRSEVTLLAACEPAKNVSDPGQAGRGQAGRGQAGRGQAMRGVARGIQLAGSARVVLSQWWTDDKAASALMGHFYRFWNNGQTPVPLALRRAQYKVTAQAGWQHPKYWAGWQVWGAR